MREREKEINRIDGFILDLSYISSLCSYYLGKRIFDKYITVVVLMVKENNPY